MTREEYDLLKKSGMMWEIWPSWTGNWEKDKSRAESKKLKHDFISGLRNDDVQHREPI